MPFRTARISSWFWRFPADEARRLLHERPLAVPITDIGEFLAEPGLWQIDRSGVRRPLAPRGWQHT